MDDSHPTPWLALELGQYEDAIQLFSQDYVQSQQLRLIAGRAQAYLAANLPRQALTDIEEVITRTDKRLASTSDYAFWGVCHWYLAQPDAAIAQWRAGLGAPYVDAAGGILLPTLLLYAGVRLGESGLEEEALRLLRTHWQKLSRRVRRRKDAALITLQNFADPQLWNWPGAIVPFFLGQQDSAWLLHQAHQTDAETLALRHECQAQFAIAVDALRSGNHALFATSMAACRRNPKGYLEMEHYLARWEMSEGYPNPPFVAARAAINVLIDTPRHDA